MPKGIDYSKWDHFDDSGDDDPGPPAIHATVLGFAGRDADQLNGNYTCLPLMNHKRPVFRRLAIGAPPAPVREPVLYFWDERDGDYLCGWWFGPQVGSDMVWAFNPGDAPQPPPAGWREPWFYDVSPRARFLLTNSPVPPVTVQEPPLPALAPLLMPVIAQLRKLPAVWRCVQCFGPLRSPCVLPCGHLVCLEHALAKGAAYCCPWDLGCVARRGYGAAGWHVASQVDGLLASLPAPASSGAEPVTEQLPAHDAVKRARTPRSLVLAYDALGESSARAGRVADAAAAFAAARFAQEEAAGGALSLDDMNAAPECHPALQRHKIQRAKANCWLKRCGDSTKLTRATAELPTPQAPEQEEDVEAFAARLRVASSGDALQAAAECPVCYGPFFEPVATPCGHIYCRRCLGRTLDCEGDCPLCRGRLAGCIEDFAVCEALQDLLTALWPEAYSRQLQELAAEQRELREGDWLPLFASLLALPTQPCTIHVFEPRYRFMIRQAISSGLRTFGACAGGADFGTELLLRNVHMLPNGRSLVETVGARRFRVLETALHDGYSRARVEYLDELDKTWTGLPDLLEALSSCPLPLQLPPLDSAAKGQEAAKADEFAWTVLQCLPVHAEVKSSFLGISSREERLRKLVHLVNELSDAAISSQAGAAAGDL